LNAATRAQIAIEGKVGCVRGHEKPQVCRGTVLARNRPLHEHNGCRQLCSVEQKPKAARMSFFKDFAESFKTSVSKVTNIIERELSTFVDDNVVFGTDDLTFVAFVRPDATKVRI
jgi:translation elongation factor EF-Tu-like GTPase